MKTLEEMIAELPPEQQREIEKRTAEIIAEEMTMRGLRKARKAAQNRLAKKLSVTHEQLALTEQRADLHIAALRRSVEALGGTLSLIAEFPDGAAVALAGFSTIADSSPGEEATQSRSRRKPTGKTQAPRTTGVHMGTAIQLQS